MTCEMVESVWANIRFFLDQLDPEVRRLELLHSKILEKKESGLFSLTCSDMCLFEIYNLCIFIKFH